MSEKSLFSPFEHLGRGLLDVAIGIGAIALGIRFFKNSFNSAKENKKK